MKYLPFLLIGLFLSCNGNSREKMHFTLQDHGLDKNSIVWNNDRSLVYADFKGVIPSLTSWAGLTESAVSLSYHYNTSTIVSADVLSVFNQSKSWMRVKTPEILIHEQVHFNITELFARKLRKKIEETISWKPSPEKKISAYFNEATAGAEAMQDQYDTETRHSIDVQRQKLWEAKVDSLLKVYDAFKK